MVWALEGSLRWFGGCGSGYSLRRVRHGLYRLGPQAWPSRGQRRRPIMAQLTVANPVRMVTAHGAAYEAEGQQNRKWPTHWFPYLSLIVPLRACHACPCPRHPVPGRTQSTRRCSRARVFGLTLASAPTVDTLHGGGSPASLPAGAGASPTCGRRALKTAHGGFGAIFVLGKWPPSSNSPRQGRLGWHGQW